MGLFNFRKTSKPDSPKQSPPPSAAASAGTESYLPVVAGKVSTGGKFTSLDGDDFLLQLPFQWDQVPNESSLEFHNKLLPEQLFITARRTRDNLSLEQRTLLITMLVQSYQNRLTEASKDKAILKSTKPVHNGAESEGRLYAKSPGVQTAVGVRYIPNRVLTFSLYRYADNDIGAPFDIYAGTILDLLKMKPH
jgi:hypothetical protein